MGENTRWRDRDPSSPAEAYDMLRFFFGLGDWSDLSEQKWYEARNKEIAKLKSSMTRRRCSLAEVVLAARFCAAHQVTVKYVTDIFKHLADAKAEQRVNARPQLDVEVEAAVAFEQGLADDRSAEWVATLSRAQGTYREGVLAEWRRSRGLMTSSVS